MKKLLKMTLMLALSVLILAIPAQAASAQKKAYKSYSQWIRKGAKIKDKYGYYTKYNKFSLTDIDNDGVKELVACRSSNGVDSFHIRSFKKGKVTTLNFASGVGHAGGFRGFSWYVPERGLVVYSQWQSTIGHVTLNIYHLGAKKFHRIVLGTYDMTYEGPRIHATWNKQSVPYETFEQNLNSLYTKEMERGFGGADAPFVGKKDILRQLKAS